MANIRARLTYADLATVLAALRYWQAADMPIKAVHDPDLGGYFAEYAPLTALEIDALCERINTKD